MTSSTDEQPTLNDIQNLDEFIKDFGNSLCNIRNKCVCDNLKRMLPNSQLPYDRPLELYPFLKWLRGNVKNFEDDFSCIDTAYNYFNQLQKFNERIREIYEETKEKYLLVLQDSKGNEENKSYYYFLDALKCECRLYKLSMNMREKDFNYNFSKNLTLFKENLTDQIMDIEDEVSNGNCDEAIYLKLANEFKEDIDLMTAIKKDCDKFNSVFKCDE